MRVCKPNKSLLTARRDEVKTTVEDQIRQWEEGRKLWPPFRAKFREGLTSDAKMWRRWQRTSTVKTAIENGKDNLIVSPYDILLSLSSWRDRLSFHMLFLPPRWQLKSVEENFFILAKENKVLLLWSLFSHHEVIRRSDWHLRRRATSINSFDTEW